MPLVKGRYPVSNPLWAMFGQPSNLTQSDLPPRSNLEVFGLEGLADTAAALTTAVATAVAVPVQVGDVITRISVRVGATAGATMTNQWAALYSGISTPALIAQSVDGTSGAIAASGTFNFALPSPIVITPALAPNGFIYVSIMVKASTVPSLATVTTATAVAGPFFTGGPTLSQTHGSTLTATAPATIASGSAQAAIPAVWLT